MLERVRVDVVAVREPPKPLVEREPPKLPVELRELPKPLVERVVPKLPPRVDSAALLLLPPKPVPRP